MRALARDAGTPTAAGTGAAASSARRRAYSARLSGELNRPRVIQAPFTQQRAVFEGLCRR
ncbi:MAG: hypothetical protein ABGY75_21490 [Gemmataceae bacterium]